jgi:hypothetical protein
MQDATAESIKSLEGFRIAWIEEAQTLSQRSLSRCFAQPFAWKDRSSGQVGIRAARAMLSMTFCVQKSPTTRSSLRRTGVTIRGSRMFWMKNVGSSSLHRKTD